MQCNNFNNLYERRNVETILVIDDGKEQREIASDMLTRLAYKVEVASSGEDAITYLRKNQVDAIVLDMIIIVHPDPEKL